MAESLTVLDAAPVSTELRLGMGAARVGGISDVDDTVGGSGLGIGFSTGFVMPSSISCT